MAVTKSITAGIRKLFQKILPQKTLADMEAESKLWMIQCSNCKFERSVWESGGIRWKAAGTPRRMMQCRNCGQFTLHVIYKKESA